MRLNKKTPVPKRSILAPHTPLHAGTIPRIARATPVSIIPQYTRNIPIAKPKPMNFSLRCVVIARGIPTKTKTRLEKARVNRQSW